MSVSIKRIEENYVRLLRDGIYYENEIFSKFEDAFLMEIPLTMSTGITLLHGQRSMVTYSTSGMKNVRGELADIRILMYSPKRNEIRQVFFQ